MTTQLSPKEKRRLNKFISNIRQLSKWKYLPPEYKFIKKQQIKAVLKILGENHANKVMVADALDIILDRWPFKRRRLRKLINGRRR